MVFFQETTELLAKETGIPAEEIAQMLEIPPEKRLGDLAFPTFKLAKIKRKAPPLIAQEIAQAVRSCGIYADVSAVNAYVNFFFDRAAVSRGVLRNTLQKNVRYGSSVEGAGKTITIDYSSINIAKPFHIGHLSSTAIGNSLYRIFKFLGYECVGINHLGDWGTQFGKLIVAFKRWGDKKAIERESVRGLLKIYVKFHDEAEKDPSLNDEARAWFKKIEDGDDEAMRLFDWFKELTLKEVQKVYDMLGVRFDSYAGESFYNDKMQRVIDELNEKQLLIKSDGAYVVNLDHLDMPPCIILKNVGTSLYSTRDLAAAIYRKDTYDFDKNLYVVAYQQTLHFRQVFAVIEMLGYKWAKDMRHIAFGMVSVEEGTLSTRKGNVVFLEDVLNKAVEKTRAVIEKKSPRLEDKDGVAKQVGVGAVVFNILYNSRIKDVTFSWDQSLNFDGETGPYVQYTHARCCSVLRKAGNAKRGDIDFSQLTDDEAYDVIMALDAFPQAVADAANRYEPCMVTRFCITLAQAYNKFYFERRIIGEAPEVEAARLALTTAVKNTLATALDLIGLQAPEQM